MDSIKHFLALMSHKGDAASLYFFIFRRFGLSDCFSWIFWSRMVCQTQKTISALLDSSHSHTSDPTSNG